MQTTITIIDDLQSFIEAQAAQDNVSVDLWCERKLNALCKKLFKDSVIEKVSSDSVPILKQYDTAIEEVKAEITAAEQALPDSANNG